MQPIYLQMTMSFHLGMSENHHALAFQTPLAYADSFFPQTIRDWNTLTDSLLSAAEGAEDSVAMFTSLVRARD